MRQRSRTGGKSVKARPYRAATQKRRNVSKAMRNRGVSAAGQETVVARLTHERDEALEQLSAASEVLRIISSSPELTPAFNAMLENAVRLCGAEFGNLYLYDGEAFHTAALHSASQAYAEVRRRPLVLRELHPDSPLVRMARTKAVIHIADARTEKSYIERDPRFSEFVDRGGARTILVVPMLKDDKLIGTITIYRQEVRTFTGNQIALLQNFAAQAVIAIENARLLNELRQSLEQQTATADVLRVISSSPGELEPVFQATLENATRICEATSGLLVRVENDDFRIVASLHRRADIEDITHRTFRLGPSTIIGRVARTRQIVHVTDVSKHQVYLNREPLAVWAVEQANVRTVLVVPMVKQEELVGVFGLEREEVKPFTDKQIELAQNFAAQAVIAIENTRLLNELRGRTQELTEALEQRTATSEVLGVISSAQSELESVFDTILANALRLCDADMGHVVRAEAGTLSVAAMRGVRLDYAQFWRERGPWQPAPDSAPAQAMEQKKPVQIADMSQTSGYAAGGQATVAAVKLGGLRTALLVPMVTDEKAIGFIVIYRNVVRPFSDKQIALVENFAKQAVIAIENARLLNELRERTQELEARSQEIAKLNQQLEQRVADQVGEIERMGRLRRFLPPQVADLIVASGTEKQLESHRREITALFCDLRGFTGFSESSDPEDVMALLRDYHAAIGQIIIKYGGTLERFAGDGVMVIFNDPVPVENPALQAVLMALDMRTAIGAMIEKWRLLGHDLGFGIGIAHGFATLGTIGFEGRFDYAAIGTVSNVASRLCDEAKPGQILISPRVMLAVDKTITVELVGEFNLKGIRRPMAAYNVLAPSISKPN